jgi:hypothetical protein
MWTHVFLLKVYQCPVQSWTTVAAVWTVRVSSCHWLFVQNTRNFVWTLTGKSLILNNKFPSLMIQKTVFKISRYQKFFAELSFCVFEINLPYTSYIK